MIYQFVGGSLDGLEQDIPPEMNYRVKNPRICETINGVPFIVAEVYQITDFSRREFNFVGWETYVK